MARFQLSDALAAILSNACAGDDGAVFPVTASLKGAGNVCKSLLKRGLIEEIAASDRRRVSNRPPRGAFIPRSGAGDCAGQGPRVVRRGLVVPGRVWALGCFCRCFRRRP